MLKFLLSREEFTKTKYQILDSGQPSDEISHQCVRDETEKVPRKKIFVSTPKSLAREEKSEKEILNKKMNKLVEYFQEM